MNKARRKRQKVRKATIRETPRPSTPIVVTASIPLEELRSRPVLELLEAASVLGIGRTRAYALAASGDFPCPVIRVGRNYRVPSHGLLKLLNLL